MGSIPKTWCFLSLSFTIFWFWIINLKEERKAISLGQGASGSTPGSSIAATDGQEAEGDLRHGVAMWKNVRLAIYGVSVEAPLPSVPH